MLLLFPGNMTATPLPKWGLLLGGCPVTSPAWPGVLVGVLLLVLCAARGRGRPTSEANKRREPSGGNIEKKGAYGSRYPLR